MKKQTSSARSKQRMKCSKLTQPDAPPHEVRAHHLLCAVCVRGGCKTPPVPKRVIDKLLKVIWEYPYASLKITADVDVIRAHYVDTYDSKCGKGVSKDVRKRQADYVARKKDLEVIRRLGIIPNTVLPAHLAYNILFHRAPTLEGICRTGSKKSKAWPECPHARRDYYKRIAGTKRRNLAEQNEFGEKLDDEGLWAMVRSRTREDMVAAKKTSARFIEEDADRLYIRPAHLLCLICTSHQKEVLQCDNLIELQRRMDENPDIPVTLTEGCCMVCDSCNVYHPGEHLCYGGHIHNGLFDLMLMERLGLAPGATLSACKLYGRIYERVNEPKEICGFGDGMTTSFLWTPCGSVGPAKKRFREMKRKGLFTKPDVLAHKESQGSASGNG